MNRAHRRRAPKKPELADPRLWDHEPLFAQRWLCSLRINLPNESEIERDMAFARGKDMGFVYLPDGSKVMRMGAREVRIPSRETVLGNRS